MPSLQATPGRLTDMINRKHIYTNDIKSFVLPTLMIEDIVKTAPQEDRVFVAGNWHLTYRGFDAWIISNEFDMPKYGFKAGKYKEGEDINGINYFPCILWYNFM